MVTISTTYIAGEREGREARRRMEGEGDIEEEEPCMNIQV